VEGGGKGERGLGVLALVIMVVVVVEEEEEDEYKSLGWEEAEEER